MKLSITFSRLALVAVAFFFLTPSLKLHAQTIYHVDANAPLTGSDGLQWSTAFPALELALTVATNQDSIWVAAGTYTPRSTTIQGIARSVSYVVPAGVEVFGGFDGTETVFDQRAGLFSQTILSGEIGTALPSDNAFHVLTFRNNDSPCLLDGFVVRDGNAMGATIPGGGAALVLDADSVEFRNVRFEDNMANLGGALVSSRSELDVALCTFSGNTSTDDGGAIFLRESRMRASHCFFLDNASRRRGGAVAMDRQATTSELLNCVFAENFSVNQGGAIFVAPGQQLGPGATIPAGDCRITNCTVYGNSSILAAGGGLWADESATVPPNIEVNNSIFWENSDNVGAGTAQIGGVLFTSYCDVQGGYAGVSNIDSDPLFFNPAAGNFRIPRMSPCRDTGNTSLLLMDILDVDGNMNDTEQLPIDIYDGTRVVSGIVDIGADETVPGGIGPGGDQGDAGNGGLSDK